MHLSAGASRWFFCSVNTGKFVNRGFLNGPVCPIYGFGATVVIVILTPIENRLFLLFIGSVILTSLLELITGFLLKKLFHTTWWDYSDQPFNIGGYICLKFSLAWGLACILLMKVIHPLLSSLVELIPNIVGIILLIVFYATLLADVIVTVTAILKLNKDLGEITKIAQGLHKGSESLAKNIGNKAIEVAHKVEEMDFADQKEKVTLKWEEGREKIHTIFSHPEIAEKLEPLLNRNARIRKRLLNAFPSMHKNESSAALEQLKQYLLNGKKHSKNTSDAQKEINDTTEEDSV